jgi:hypothetical protein
MADWDRILSAAPLNAEAARVTGENREPVGFRKALPDPHLRDGPHLLRPIPDDPKFVDLTGQRFGALVVRGLAEGLRQSTTGTAWAVRCDCGAYTVRRSAGLKAGRSVACSECTHAEEVRQGRAVFQIPVREGRARHG